MPNFKWIHCVVLAVLLFASIQSRAQQTPAKTAGTSAARISDANIDYLYKALNIPFAYQNAFVETLVPSYPTTSQAKIRSTVESLLKGPASFEKPLSPKHAFFSKTTGPRLKPMSSSGF